MPANSVGRLIDYYALAIGRGRYFLSERYKTYTKFAILNKQIATHANKKVAIYIAKYM